MPRRGRKRPTGDPPLRVARAPPRDAPPVDALAQGSASLPRVPPASRSTHGTRGPFHRKRRCRCSGAGVGRTRGANPLPLSACFSIRLTNKPQLSAGDVAGGGGDGAVGRWARPLCQHLFFFFCQDAAPPAGYLASLVRLPKHDCAVVPVGTLDVDARWRHQPGGLPARGAPLGHREWACRSAPPGL